MSSSGSDTSDAVVSTRRDAKTTKMINNTPKIIKLIKPIILYMYVQYQHMKIAKNLNKKKKTLMRAKENIYRNRCERSILGTRRIIKKKRRKKRESFECWKSKELLILLWNFLVFTIRDGKSINEN